MNSLTQLSSKQLRQAADIQDRIASLQRELAGVLGETSSSEASAPTRGARRGGRRMSAAGRAAISAAAKARWGSQRSPQAPKPTKLRRTMSAAAKAKIAAAAKARWKKAKAAEKK